MANVAPASKAVKGPVSKPAVPITVIASITLATPLATLHMNAAMVASVLLSASAFASSATALRMTHLPIIHIAIAVAIRKASCSDGVSK